MKRIYLIILSVSIGALIIGAVVFIGVSRRDYNDVKIKNAKKSVGINNKLDLKVKRVKRIKAEQKSIGNSNGNLMNYGFTEYGYEGTEKYTYFTDIAGQCKIFKIGSDKRKIKVSDRQAHDICFVNGWLYCRDWHNGYVFKVRPDGTRMQDIIKVKTMNVQITKDSIYYTKYSDGSLHITDINGKNQKDLLKNEDICNLNIMGNWIYYNSSKDKYIYKVKLDGTNKTKISEDMTESYGLVVKNEWIYYINHDAGDSLYKIKIDGSNRIKVINEEVNCVNITDDYIIYTNKNNIIYRTKLDGSNKMKLNDISTSFISITEGYIYYTSPDFDKLYRIKIDGSGKEDI